jgi:tRNA splicing endonuclease
MYTNLDSFGNKKAELESRIAIMQPDVIGLTEINPKNAKWQLSETELKIQGYLVYVNLKDRGVALYVRDQIASSEVVSSVDGKVGVWCEV